MNQTKYFVILLFCVTTLVVDHAYTANILVVAFFSIKSHKLTYLPLIEELGKRGHNITLVTPIKPVKTMKNVKEIFTLDVDKIFQANQFDAFEAKEKGLVIDVSKILEMVHDTCTMTYDLPHVRALLQEKFDLVILQPYMNDCVLGMIYRLQVPFVLFTPTSVPPSIASQIGGHLPPAITPNVLWGYSLPMTFLQRFKSFGADVMINLFMSLIYEPKVEKIYRDKLGDDIPSLREILGNTSMVLSNGHFSMVAPKPYYPDVVDVGGIHSRPAKPLPKDIEEFIGKGKDGFILFSMGSAIKGTANKRVRFYELF